MRNSRFNEEEIIHVLDEVGDGERVKYVCRSQGTSEGTDYRWKAKYGIMRKARPKSLPHDAVVVLTHEPYSSPRNLKLLDSRSSGSISVDAGAPGGAGEEMGGGRSGVSSGRGDVAKAATTTLVSAAITNGCARE